MNNKRIVNALAALILPGLDRLDQKCNRIISELSELKSTSATLKGILTRLSTNWKIPQVNY